MFESSKKYVDANYRKVWDDCYKVYQRKRVKYHYEGISDPVIPETFTIVESLVANIAGGKPRFEFFPTNEEQARDTTTLNNLVAYYLECNKIDLLSQKWVRSMLMYGTGVIEVSWVDGKPKLKLIPLRNFIFDPQASDLEPARFAGHRYIADKTELERAQEYDPEQDKMVPKYKDLNKLGKDAPSGDGDEGNAFDKEFKERMQGTTLDNDGALENQVEVIRIHDRLKGRIYEIANRKTKIYDKKTWCYKEEEEVDVQAEVDGQIINSKKKLSAIKPFLPYALLRDYIDESLLLGMGEIEVIMDRAEMLNDWEAMDVDNAALVNTPVGWVDPQFADLIPEIEVAPNAFYPIPRNAMGFLERPAMGSDLSIKKAETTEQMRRATAADEVIQGSVSDKGRVTATEVNSTVSQAQQRFSTKINNLEAEGFAQLGSIIYKCIQIFVTQKTAVRIAGPQGVSFKDYDPAEFTGDYEPHCKLDSTIKKQKVERGQKDNQIYQLMLNNPAYNQAEISQWMVKRIDPDITDQELEKLMAPPAPPPQKDPLETIQMNYKDAGPWIKAQIEKKLELEPDPMHEIEMQSDAMRHAAQQEDLTEGTTSADNAPIPALQPPVTEEATSGAAV